MPRWRHEGRYDTEVAIAARRFAVPESLIKAVIGAESGFNPQAVRGEPHLNDASRGLMQVLFRTAEALGFKGTREMLFIPQTNIALGAQLLAQNYQALGKWPDAISAYNGGLRPHLGFGRRATAPVRVCLARNADGDCTRWHDTPVGEYGNQEYVDRVLAYQQYFEREPPSTAAMGGGVVLVALAALAAATAGS